MDGDRSVEKLGIIALFNLSPNFYAFLGGVYVSTAVNLYTGVFAGEAIPTRWRTILLSALLALVSGILWSVIAWNLEMVNRLAIIQSPEFIDEQKIWKKLLIGRLPKLIIGLIGALSCAIISSIALLF